MKAAPTPAVSIITPAYNAEKTLAHTIDSCLAQTFPDFEHLVVDDGSTDGSAALVLERASRDPRVRLVRRPNGGAGAARNTGLQHARGRYIALLDSDDLWMPDYLERQLALLASHPEAAIATANAINLGGVFDGTPLWPASTRVRLLSLVDVLSQEDAVCIMSIFRREVADRIGGFDEQLANNEDYEFWLRAAHAGFRIVADQAPRAFYRRRPDSKSASSRAMLKGIGIVLRQIRTSVPAGSDEMRAIDRQLERFEQELLLADARVALERRSPAEAMSALARIPSRSRPARASLLLGLGRLWPPAMTLAYRVRRKLRETWHHAPAKRAWTPPPGRAAEV